MGIGWLIKGLRSEIKYIKWHLSIPQGKPFPESEYDPLRSEKVDKDCVVIEQYIHMAKEVISVQVSVINSALRGSKQDIYLCILYK